MMGFELVTGILCLTLVTAYSEKCFHLYPSVLKKILVNALCIVADGMPTSYFSPVFLYLLLYLNTQCLILSQFSPD